MFVAMSSVVRATGRSPLRANGNSISLDEIDGINSSFVKNFGSEISGGFIVLALAGECTSNKGKHELKSHKKANNKEVNLFLFLLLIITKYFPLSGKNQENFLTYKTNLPL